LWKSSSWYSRKRGLTGKFLYWEGQHKDQVGEENVHERCQKDEAEVQETVKGVEYVSDSQMEGPFTKRPLSSSGGKERNADEERCLSRILLSGGGGEGLGWELD